jgi:hypothetical protein
MQKNNIFASLVTCQNQGKGVILEEGIDCKTAHQTIKIADDKMTTPR